MKIKIVINGKSVEIEIKDTQLAWKSIVNDRNPDQLVQLIAKIIQELKS
jgi:hypothetical protein